VYDALTHDRVYRPALSSEETVGIMQEQAGHFDPDLLDLSIERVVANSPYARSAE